MNAAQLVDSIFRRDQPGAAANVRQLTFDQFKYLRDLILNEEHRGTVSHGLDGSLIWARDGKESYQLSENRVAWKHSLTRLASPGAGSGTLFG